MFVVNLVKMLYPGICFVFVDFFVYLVIKSGDQSVGWICCVC